MLHQIKAQRFYTDSLALISPLSHLILTLKSVFFINFSPWETVGKSLEVLEKSLNFTQPFLYEPCIGNTVSSEISLFQYEKTRHAVYSEEDGIHTILELMQIYREKKGLIFIKACTLLGILALDSSCKMVSFFFNISGEFLRFSRN